MLPRCVMCTDVGSMLLASQAVHGAMAGLTGFSVGLVNDRTIYAPMPLLTSVCHLLLTAHLTQLGATEAN